MKSALVTLIFSCLFHLLSVSLPAQGCTSITYSVIKLEPCRYRLQVQNTTSDCYQQTMLNLDQATYYSWTANTAEGWVVEEVSPTELLVTHTNGLFPLTTTWVIEFSSYIPIGTDAKLICLYDDLCVLEGCESILDLESCPPICIDGNVYRECEELEYLDQPTLENWTIQLLDDMGNVLDEQLSGMDGTYQFCDLNPGVYHVQVIIPNGWSPSVPILGMIAITADPGVNPTARFGVCPDCGCDQVDFLIQQEASQTDTAYYAISMFNLSSYCYEYLEIEVLKGTLTGWDMAPFGWTIEEVLPGLLHMESFNTHIPEGNLQAQRIQIVSSDTAHIEVSAYWKAKADGKCRDDKKFPSPPKNANLTCCPDGFIAGPELVDNYDFNLNTAPATDYLYTPGPLSPGEIYIMNQVQAYASNPAWICPGIFDSSDTYLAVDGSGNNNLFAWKQTFTNLTPNTTYGFCAWFNNLVKPGQNFDTPLIEMVIQDDIAPFMTWTSTPYLLPENPDYWVSQSLNWTSPVPLSSSYTIKIRSLAAGSIGNDFAIDKISFRSCTPPPDTCVCNDPTMILTRNGIDYPLPCTKGAPSTVLPCPVGDAVVSGFFGCESINGNLCDETVVNWQVNGPNFSNSGSTTNFPSVLFSAATISAPGTYQLNLSTLCPGSADSCLCTAQWIQEVCDTCYCGGFDHLYLRGPQGAPSQALTCGGPAITLVCPDPGQGFTITGNFSCEGDSCPTEHLIEWGLTQPDGTIINMSFWDNDPLFGITLLPNYFNQSGVYTLNLTGYCGDDTCHCELTFIVDCPNQCPCDIADILALSDNVDKGFAVSYSNKSCTACFSPLALSKCEQVDWYINTTSGTPIGTTWGNQTYCHVFPASGTYTVNMVVTRLKPDGSLCEAFVKSQTVSVSCIVWPDCANSTLKNPSFNVDGVAGDIGPGGMGSAPGWMAAEGHPTLLEGSPPGNQDGWTMQLLGNFDDSDVLMTEDVYCLSKTDKGTLSLRLAGDPIPGASVKVGRKPPGGNAIIQLVPAKAGSPPPHPCQDKAVDCFTIANLEDLLPIEEGDWYDIQIPYDLSDWAAQDSCGDGSGGIPVRLAMYVWNPISADQCTCPTKHAVQIDHLCFDPETVSTKVPDQGMATITIYPNPTTGQLRVNLPTQSGNGNRLEVVDLTGRLLISQVIPTGEWSQQIDLSPLSSGLYFLRWTDGIRTLARQRVVKE